VTAFAELLAQLRKRRGLTQAQLARLLGWDPTYLSRLETGQRRLRSRDQILSIAAVLALDRFDADALLRSARFAPVLESPVPHPDVLRQEERLRGRLAKLDRLLDLMVDLDVLIADNCALTDLLGGEDSFARLMESFLLRICVVLDSELRTVYRACIILPDETSDYMHIRYHVGLSDESVRERRFAYTAGSGGELKPEMGLAGLVYVTRQTQLVRDVQSDPRYVRLDKRGLTPYKSLICAPLVVQGGCLGVLSIDAAQDVFDETIDPQIVCLLAKRIGILLVARRAGAQPAPQDAGGEAPDSIVNVA